MNTEQPEPLAAVLAEMRDFADHRAADAGGERPGIELLRSYADRIEAAAERERDEDRQLAAIAESDEAFARCARCDRPERERRVDAAARRSHALGYSVARRPWRCFDKSEGTACVVDAGGVHVCDATKADAELIVEAVNALAVEDTP
jgi:hypothetical protein